jgi:hypothetical protein
VLQDHLLPRLGEVGLRVLDVDALHVHPALREALLQDVEHLLELELDLRLHHDDEFVLRIARELRTRALEVEPLRQLAVGLVDAIGHLVTVQLGNDVE